MRIIQAKAAGFCMGVRRAMNTVLEESHKAGNRVLTHGPLIHNPQVIEVLGEKGVAILDEDADPPRGATVVIRAHGVPPREKARLEGAGCGVVDATCPHVIRIQKLIARHIEEERSVVIIGDRGHAEVEGLLGYAGDRGHVVSRPEEVDALSELDDVCVVSQTTQNAEHFERIVERIRGRWPRAAIHKTICNATERRQQETIDLARSVDAMIVVGGRNSANTVRLAELAAETGTPTMHVETADEIDFERLRGKRAIGLTAGASTPNWMLVDVTERLKELFRSEWALPVRVGFAVLKVFVDANVGLAAGALATAWACALLQGRPFSFPAALVGALYLFGVYSLDIRGERQSEHFIDPQRWLFHERWRRLLVLAGAGGLGAAVFLSWFLGPFAFALTALATAAGVFYRLSFVPERFTRIFRYRRLIDIPGSKDLFVGAAWALLLVVLPWFVQKEGVAARLDAMTLSTAAGLGLTAYFVFTLVFVRSVITDFRDIQSDQIVGRETIPIVLGKARTKRLLAILTGLLVVGLVAGAASGVVSSVGYALLLPVAYTWGYLYLFHRRLVTRGVAFGLLVDGAFLLVGATAGFWAWLF